VIAIATHFDRPPSAPESSQTRRCKAALIKAIEAKPDQCGTRSIKVVLRVGALEAGLALTALFQYRRKQRAYGEDLAKYEFGGIIDPDQHGSLFAG